MKICHVINNLKGGGAQNILVSLALTQVKLGNEVSVITIDNDDLEYSNNLKKKLQASYVKVDSLNREVGSKCSTLNSIVKGLFKIRKLNPQIINSHLEMSHVFSAIFKYFRFRAKWKHIITVHNAPEKWSKICTTMNGKKPIIFCSKSAQELNNFPSKQKIIIENGVEIISVSTHNKINIRRELNIPNDSQLIICTGSLRPQKNYLLTIEIAKQINNPKIHFLICGGAYGDGYLSSTIFREISNIHYLGLRSDVRELLQECECFLSCSTFEGLPVAVLEAFFNGIPCVLSPIPQHIDISLGIKECYIPDSFEPSSFIVEIDKALKVLKVNRPGILTERTLPLQRFLIDNTADRYIKFYQKMQSS